MEKLFHFDTPRDGRRCDAAVVWRLDNRFEPAFLKFLKRIGVQYSDSIRIAAGARLLASPEHESDREFVLAQIRKSIRLHGPARTILMPHSDCGAYGGLAGKFGGDPPAGRQHHLEKMERAKATLRAEMPGVQVDGRLVDFEGVWG
jgi:hypothetical protein